MKATVEGKIENARVTKENIVLDLEFSGKDALNRAATGHLKLVIPNSGQNSKMQIGRTIHITITDGEDQ
jgi:hypothetical protein